MRTYVECLVCYMNNALSLAKRSGLSEAGQLDVLTRTASMLSEFTLESTPPLMSRSIHKIVQQVSGVMDPYYEEKKESNRQALLLMNEIENKVMASEDPLLNAVEYAIAGNSMDFGAYQEIDIMSTISEMIIEEKAHKKNEEPQLFNYQSLKKAIENSSTLLYITDNAGEIVFDFILLRIIVTLYNNINITVAVRGHPVLNDATIEDIRQIGLNSEFKVISSGSDVPGTIVDETESEFRDLFYTSDLVVSKGQGNYETLHNEKRIIYFLLKSKCEVIARHTGSRLGDILLLKGGRENG